MEPLTPEDLLIRHQPIDNDRWFRAEGEEDKPRTNIPLERFQTLEHVIRDSPINVDPYLELARIYLQTARWNDAKRVLDLAHTRFSEHEEVSFLREEALMARSLQLFNEAQRAHQTEPTRLTEESLERCRIELNVLREKVCRARLVRHPDKLQLNLPLATALNNLGQQEDAIRCLQQAIVHPHLRSAASLQLGHILESAKRIPEALSAYRRAALFRVPPPTAAIKLKALTAAANLAQRSNMIDSARRYVQLLLEMQSDNKEMLERQAKLSDQSL